MQSDIIIGGLTTWIKGWWFWWRNGPKCMLRIRIPSLLPCRERREAESNRNESNESNETACVEPQTVCRTSRAFFLPNVAAHSYEAAWRRTEQLYGPPFRTNPGASRRMLLSEILCVIKIEKELSRPPSLGKKSKNLKNQIFF